MPDGTKRDTLLKSPMAEWLLIEPGGRENVYVMRFAERHVGNPFIRAIHGGVVGSLIEMSAELELSRRSPGTSVELVSSAIDYLRVTKDADMHARVEEVRIARRLAFFDVWCWQDDEALPVARGSCIVRLLDQPQ
jgi:acyl-coenzyme A thioesterase PaaI-like protein